MKSLDKFEAEIVETLEKNLFSKKGLLEKVGSSSRALKTITVLSSLTRFGIEQGYSVYTNYDKRCINNLKKKIGESVVKNIIKDAEPHWPEWLWDLCWADHSGKPYDWRAFKSLKLACECELQSIAKNNDDNIDIVLEDFLKLIVCDAELRLIIFQYSDLGKAGEIIAECKSYSPPDKNFKYCALAFPCDFSKEKDFICESWAK